MATMNLLISSDLSNNTMNENFQRSTSSKYATVQALSQLLQRLNSGGLKGATSSRPSVVVSLPGVAVQASGTFTLTSVVATDAISINGVTFTAVASGATGNQFNVGASDTETATNLAAAINASVTALVAGYVTASSLNTVVTVTAVLPGITGNAMTIASADGTIVASGARLTAGAADANEKTYSF